MRSRQRGTWLRLFMTTDPRNPAAQARKELGARLRQLRKSAGLTGQALAAETSQHFTRVSRIENGAQAPTDRNIHDWCTACGAEDQIPDLIASARSVASRRWNTRDAVATPKPELITKLWLFWTGSEGHNFRDQLMMGAGGSCCRATPAGRTGGRPRAP
jgi:transcriptional regulator with XRE-family HTH domain